MSDFFNSKNNTAREANGQNTGSGTSKVQQALYGIAVVFVVYLVLLFSELAYHYFNRLHMNRTELLPYTYNIDDKAVIISQNPNVKRSKPTALSDNERSGVEFSYSFYLYVHPAAFRQEYGLLHLFHKGYSQPFPLMGPGVFMRSDTNTLRVYMNTFKGWNQYVEVQNIPVSKWVHMTIVCQNHALEVYVNGNLSRKMSFDGYAPYQNYQDIVCFSQRRMTLTSSKVASVDDLGFDVFGAMKGMMSRLTYFNYALTYGEIQQLMNEGPSSEMDSSLMNDVPPYLADTWWSQSH
jgi:hypothetical protein